MLVHQLPAGVCSGNIYQSPHSGRNVAVRFEPQAPPKNCWTNPQLFYAQKRKLLNQRKISYYRYSAIFRWWSQEKHFSRRRIFQMPHGHTLSRATTRLLVFTLPIPVRHFNGCYLHNYSFLSDRITKSQGEPDVVYPCTEKCMFYSSAMMESTYMKEYSRTSR